MMLILLLLVVGVVAQPDFNDMNINDLPLNADDRIVVFNDDVGSLPPDVRRLLGSSIYDRPIPYGRYGLPREGGAGIGPEFAEGTPFGIDIDPRGINIDLNNNNNDDRGSIVGALEPRTASLYALLGIGTPSGGPPPAAPAGVIPVSIDRNSDNNDDDDGFDLSQFGIDTDTDLSRNIRNSMNSYEPPSSDDSDDSSYSFDLSDYGIGDDSDSGPSSSVGGGDESAIGSTGDDETAIFFDPSQYGINDDKKNDDDDDLGEIDLSQFGIYDDAGDDKLIDIPDSRGDGPPIDLSQFGITSSSYIPDISDDAKDDSDNYSFDISQYIDGPDSTSEVSPASSGNDDLDDDDFDLSEFLAGLDGGSTPGGDISPFVPGVDFLPFSSAMEEKAPEKTLITNDTMIEDKTNIRGQPHDNMLGKSSAISESFSFEDLGIDIPVANQNVQLNQVKGQNVPLPDTIAQNSQEIQIKQDPVVLNVPEIQKIQDSSIQNIPVMPIQRDVMVKNVQEVPIQQGADIPQFDTMTSTPSSGFHPGLIETNMPDITNSSVEYSVHSDAKQGTAMAGGFDVVQTETFDWQTLASDTSNIELSESVRKWLQL